MHTSKRYLLLYCKGIAMGAADVVPGVSGGTIALVTGIYEELIEAITRFDVKALLILRREGPGAAFRHTKASFLFTVLAGIATAIFSFSHLIVYLLNTRPVFAWSFFFGLISASLWILLRQITKWTITTIIAIAIGTVLSILIVMLPNVESTEISLGFVFFCGTIAICAMILPGISGSFILVLLGTYSFILDALSNFNLPVIVVFVCGALFGIVLFSRIISWLFARCRAPTLALMSGFVIGALVRTWPFRHLNNQGVTLENSLYPLLLIGLGILVVLGLELIGKHKQSQE